MKGFLLSFLLGMSTLKATDVPISQSLTIDVALGEYTTFTFPFVIKGADKTSFREKYNIAQTDEEVNVSGGNEDHLDEKLPPKKKSEEVTKVSSLDLKRGNHTISVYPKKYGEITFLLMGYEKYPISLKLIVNEETKGSRNYQIKDYEKKKRSALKFENTEHEKVIVVLMKYLFNNNTPDGFESVSKSKDYNTKNLQLTLVRSIIGSAYRGDTWILKNISNQIQQYHEESFYRDGIFAVSFEDNVLAPDESARMFIVRKAVKD